VFSLIRDILFVCNRGWDVDIDQEEEARGLRSRGFTFSLPRFVRAPLRGTNEAGTYFEICLATRTK
jgi:hypothetical protein